MLMANGTEIWKDVIGYEGLYQVSNWGNVKAFAKSWVCGEYNGVRKLPERLLIPQLQKKGYWAVNLRGHDGINKLIKIHRIVAKSFIENPQKKPQVNHINGNKSDNKIENLEWCTNQENIIHAYKNGLINVANSGRHGQARLVLNIQTGIFYECIQDAANTIGNGYNNYLNLYKQLTGYKPNTSNFILA
jgi:hypothetical protein